ALIVAATMFGRPFARVIVAFVAFYYAIVSRASRRNVGAFRRRLGLRDSFFASYRHILRFSQCTLDALFFMRGRTDLFRVTNNGHHHLEKLRHSKSGAILLGAHLGSFYAMRAASADERLALNPVVYTKNARKFNAVIEALDATSTTRLIEIGEGGQVAFMLKIRDRVDEGALVAILGDRVQPEGRFATVDFLGAKARLPVGPYLLAASLRRPVYFTVGVYLGGDRYELHCIPFAERIVLPRGRRDEAMAEYAQRYADMLAEFCRKFPENWFNFYDFFEE
ncbi:MAG: putative LPLAT superfamily acyltransferase, partial [Polyangiales bacterium]